MKKLADGDVAQESARLRAEWIAVLSQARTEALSALVGTLPGIPRYERLRGPESGLAMIRARAGGTGERFNLGEMTLTRCSIRLDDGTLGHGFVAGLERRHAELAALCDALLQTERHRPEVEARVIEPLTEESRRRREREARKAAATKVEFFTMVRGEDP